MKHLWEYDHPYYCAEGYAERYPSWQQFKDEWDTADQDYNLLFRWDWHALSEQDARDRHQLEVFFVLQRKAGLVSALVDVDPADEADIRAWLTARVAKIRALWEPILPEVAP